LPRPDRGADNRTRRRYTGHACGFDHEKEKFHEGRLKPVEKVLLGEGTGTAK
jgi:hypothetical protein